MGIPFDLLTPTLDTPSKFSRQALFSTPRWASLTLVLEGDHRTHLVGWSALPRDSYGGARSPYLATEGRVVAIRFLARWAYLFRRESLWHSSVRRICNVLSGRERRPLGSTFIEEVTAFVGSARWGASINTRDRLAAVSSAFCYCSRSLLSLHPLAHLKHRTPSSGEICKSPSTFR